MVAIKGVSSKFKFVETNLFGKKYKDPILSVSIEGSPYMSVDSIIRLSKTAKESINARNNTKRTG